MRNLVHAAVVVVASLSFIGPARAEDLPPYTPPGAAETPAAADTLGTAEPPATLSAADAAVEAGNLELARSLYARVAAESPDTPEAVEAHRALKILAASAQRAASRSVPPAIGQAAPTDGVVIRREPYSSKTKERLRLSAWEKLDFGTTAFLYGMSVGYTYALSLNNVSDGLPAVAAGALVYTLGAVVFLNTANPDRGDLPVALAITSYVPTTTLLVSNILFEQASSKKKAVATAAAGVLSIPLAVYAAHETDLDPGDAQLVRDAGFWGLVLGTTAMLGFGGSQSEFGFYQGPSDKKIASAGLLGLYGGLGLGALTAHFNDISLERVRVSTWGGYGGAIVSLLLAAASNTNEQETYRAVGIGALLGLGITFAATSSLDGIPPDDVAQPKTARRSVGPTFAPVVGLDGLTRTMLGVSGTLR